MTEHQTSEVKYVNKHKYKQFIFALFITVISVLVLLIGVYWYVRRGECRHILKEAKTMQLAVRMTAIEYYGLNKKFADSETKNGFADGVTELLKEVSGCTGDVYLGSWNTDELMPERLVYIENGFLVDYVYSGGNGTWNVYELKHLIVQ